MNFPVKNYTKLKNNEKIRKITYCVDETKTPSLLKNN